jgi:hypothetical protein
MICLTISCLIREGLAYRMKRSEVSFRLIYSMRVRRLLVELLLSLGNLPCE